ncbi:MAG: hypothetical protein ACFFAS_01385 [Promethearchaeota archaeon]
MTKKIISAPFIFLGVFVILLLFCNIQSVSGLTTAISKTDPTNDIVRIDPYSGSMGSGHTMDDIDIIEVNLTIAQRLTIKILGDLGNWNNYSYNIGVYLGSFNIMTGPQPPLYLLAGGYTGGSIEIYFAYVDASEDQYYWDGDSWSDYEGDAANIGGTIGSDVLFADIPTGAGYPSEGITIEDGTQLIILLIFVGSEYIYIDSVPELLTSEEIPGYDILFIGAIIGVTTLLIIKIQHNKK